MSKKYFEKENGNWVREDLNGKQKEYCMCWDCSKFKPELANKGCSIIAEVLNLAAQKEIVLPVWECNNFSAKK